MARTLRDLVAQIDDIEPTLGNAGVRDLGEALVVASAALANVLSDLQSQVHKNNKLLHDMVEVLDAFLSRDDPSA